MPTGSKYRARPEVVSAGRRVKALTKHRDPGDSDLADARRDLRFVKFREMAREAAASDPPFTPEQWSVLLRIFGRGMAALGDDDG